MTNEQLVKCIEKEWDRETSLSKLYQKNRGMLSRTAQKHSEYLAIELMQEGFIVMMQIDTEVVLDK